MTKAFVFWLLILLWVIFWFLPWGTWGPHYTHAPNVVLLALFVLLGWHCFGKPIQ